MSTPETLWVYEGILTTGKVVECKVVVPSDGKTFPIVDFPGWGRLAATPLNSRTTYEEAVVEALKIVERCCEAVHRQLAELEAIKENL